MENNQNGDNNVNTQGDGNFVRSVVKDSTIYMVSRLEKNGKQQTYKAESSKYLNFADSWLSILASIFSLLGVGGGVWIWQLFSSGYNSSKEVFDNLKSIIDSRILLEGSAFPELLVPLFIFMASLVVLVSLLSFRKFGRKNIMYLFQRKSRYFLAGFCKDGKRRIGLFKITGKCALCSGSNKGSLRAFMKPTRTWETRDRNTGNLVKSKPLKESRIPKLVCKRNESQHIFDIDLTDYKYEI